MKKIYLTILVVLLVGLAVTGCGKKDKDKEKPDTVDSVEGDISIADESGLREFEDSGEERPEEDEDEPLSEISQEDADNLIAEKLSSKGCEAVYSDTAFIDDENYYTYSVINPDGDEMEQMLAVNAVSGEIFVYDLDNNTVFDFSTFELYNSESDELVSWEGSFKSGNITLSLEPGEENSFEFSFGGDKELMGVARAEGKTASYSSEGVELEFKREKDSVTVTDKGSKSGFAGTYK